jgi:hypothetical protein
MASENERSAHIARAKAFARADAASIDDDPPTHGRDTAIYQELQPIIRKYEEWLRVNKDELFNEEMQQKANTIRLLLAEINDEVNTPL